MTTTRSTYRIQVFDLFERLWHWSQVGSILTLLFTGFGIHGLHSIIPFEDAVFLHTWVAIALLLLWVFATFWLFTTGQWRHYMPTAKGLVKVSLYYAVGIFKGEHHPYKKTLHRKHNPLQALTYLFLKIVIFPAIWVSGLAYLAISFGFGDVIVESFGLGAVAVFHTIAAIAIVVFIIAHIYLLTTGHSFVSHVAPMITGCDDVELTSEEYEYMKADKLCKIKKS